MKTTTNFADVIRQMLAEDTELAASVDEESARVDEICNINENTIIKLKMMPPFGMYESNTNIDIMREIVQKLLDNAQLPVRNLVMNLNYIENVIDAVKYLVDDEFAEIVKEEV